jgi:hypothetical protein
VRFFTTPALVTVTELWEGSYPAPDAVIFGYVPTRTGPIE